MAKKTFSSTLDEKLPIPPIARLVSPVRRFLKIESSSGVFLLICTAIALIAANSPLAEMYHAFWKTPIQFSIGEWITLKDNETIGHLLINDGLMTLFFFVVGLEIKREIVAGELSDFKKALFPVFAAIGGMVAPAGVYISMHLMNPEIPIRGWAIPMATDIAFVVGFLALFGNRVPFSLKITLLSLAIVDDLGAVLVIALVYTNDLSWTALLVAAAGFGITYTLNRLGVRAVSIYVFIGMIIWFAVYKSGVHPTVAGVLLGVLTPASAWVGNKSFQAVLEELWTKISNNNGEYSPAEQAHDLQRLEFSARESVSPLHRLETDLHPWVAFMIMPLFALANAGVPLKTDGLTDPLALAIAMGLAIGKPVGILAFCKLSVILGIAQLPRGVNWLVLTGGACLAGIGFTMALFINALAFPGAEFVEQEATGKIGILAGSLVVAIVGAGILYFALPKVAPPDEQ